MSDYPNHDDAWRWWMERPPHTGARDTAHHIARKAIDWHRARANPAPQEPRVPNRPGWWWRSYGGPSIAVQVVRDAATGLLAFDDDSTVSANDLGWQGPCLTSDGRPHRGPPESQAAPQEPPTVTWVVNDIGELGVEVGGRVLFLYKGESLEYAAHDVDGIDGDDLGPMMYRPVLKREFGECAHPFDWWRPDGRPNYPGPRYRKGDGWRPLPTPPPAEPTEAPKPTSGGSSNVPHWTFREHWRSPLWAWKRGGQEIANAAMKKGKI